MEPEVRTRSDDGHTASASESSHRTLGRYRVVAELGRGSTSIVYLGAVGGPAGFNKLFALKQLRSALAEDPALVAMFLAEARVGAQLNHPNVVTTFEIDETEALPYIVMEYLDGQPLQNLVATARLAFKPLPLHMHLAALSGALEGLEHAHTARGPDGRPLRIVHRDVSPHNVFVTSSGMPKLLDFGFAQTDGAPNTMLSSAARVAYMSPEQASGDAVDCRSDLFSVGVMLWEAVTRRRFWSEEASKADILNALTMGELPPSRVSALANAPEELRSLVVKATALDPSNRYESAAALQADLQGVLSRITPPTFNLRDLGQRLVTVFATERARLQAVIDAEREIAMTSGAGEHGGRPASRGAATSHSPPPPPVTPVTARVAQTPPEAAPAVETVNRGPLPSFPMPTVESAGPFTMPTVANAGWRLHRQPVAIGAIALSVLIGVGLSMIHPGTEDRPQASASAQAVVAPAEPASRQPILEEPLARSAAVPESASFGAEVAPPSISTETRAQAGEPVPVDSSRREPGPPVVRTGAVAPGLALPPAAAASRPMGSRPLAPGVGGGEAPIRISDGNATAARPAHPIDSANPYGP